jgi:DNA-binding MarR family transcriptional regulator
MKLETELKSTKPMQPRQRAVLNILFTASWLDCLLTRQLRTFGLTNPQYNILRILNGSYPKGLSVLDIKSRMLDRSSNVSRLVEKLRLNGLVERVPHAEDRRMVVVTISADGKKTLTDIEQARVIDSSASGPGGKLSEAEALELAHLLDKFRE